MQQTKRYILTGFGLWVLLTYVLAVPQFVDNCRSVGFLFIGKSFV